MWPLRTEMLNRVKLFLLWQARARAVNPLDHHILPLLFLEGHINTQINFTFHIPLILLHRYHMVHLPVRTLRPCLGWECMGWVLEAVHSRTHRGPHIHLIKTRFPSRLSLLFNLRFHHQIRIASLLILHHWELMVRKGNVGRMTRKRRSQEVLLVGVGVIINVRESDGCSPIMLSTVMSSSCDLECYLEVDGNVQSLMCHPSCSTNNCTCWIQNPRNQMPAALGPSTARYSVSLHPVLSKGAPFELT